MDIDLITNPFLTKEEFDIQMALGALEWFQFFDERQVDDSGCGDGPFVIWATDYKQALQIYMENHGKFHGLSGVRNKNGWFRV